MKRVGAETDIIQCPYDVSHRIIRHRFQVHLVRCRQNFPLAEVVFCPFNVTHRVNKQELDWHVTVCPERQSFENFKNRDVPIDGLSSTMYSSFCGDSTLRHSEPFRRENDASIIQTVDNWDDEPDVPTYNPLAYVEKAPVLRMPVGLTPSQRSAFRQAERKRLQSLAKF